MSMNVWCGTGRLVRDVETRATPTGKTVANFTIAVDRAFKGQDGQKETDFIDIVAFGNTATFCSSYLSKGRMVAVDGRLQIREWKAKDGTNRRAAEIVANNVNFADSKRDNAQGGYTAPAKTVYSAAPAQPTVSYAPAQSQQYGGQQYAQAQYSGFDDLDGESEDSLPF